MVYRGMGGRSVAGLGVFSEHSFQRAAIFALSLSAVAGPLACQRQAPGPWECREHAIRVVEGLGAPLVAPQVEQAFQSEISRCLTAPYDRQLVRCVEERGPDRRCYHEFELRHRTEGEASELPSG